MTLTPKTTKVLLKLIADQRHRIAWDYNAATRLHADYPHARAAQKQWKELEAAESELKGLQNEHRHAVGR